MTVLGLLTSPWIFFHVWHAFSLIYPITSMTQNSHRRCAHTLPSQCLFYSTWVTLLVFLFSQLYLAEMSLWSFLSKTCLSWTLELKKKKKKRKERKKRKGKKELEGEQETMSMLSVYGPREALVSWVCAIDWPLNLVCASEAVTGSHLVASHSMRLLLVLSGCLGALRRVP